MTTNLKSIMRDLRINNQSSSQRVSTLPIGTDNYDYHKRFINKIAGPNYVFTPELKEVWNKLFLYFIGDPEVEKLGLSLDKSIALIGTYGVGKSMIFQIVHRWLEAMQLRNPNSFRISCTEDIINLMQKQDWADDVLVMNTTENMHGVKVPSPIHVLINEFAYQYEVKSYGTAVNEFIEMFLMKRYDIFQQHGKLTHVTMNFDIDSLKSNFSARLFDRFREMFNMIPVSGKSFRK